MEELAKDLAKGQYGRHLESVLKRNALRVNQKPLDLQDQARRWRRWELLQSGMDLVTEGEARMRAARKLSAEFTYDNSEVARLVRIERQ